MILWTFRHTKPYNPQDVCYGRLDFDVSPSFEDESSAAIEDFLKTDAKPTRLFSSPLLRAKKLAEKVGSAIKLKVELEPAIQEICFGAWEGQKLTEVPRNEMAGWKNDLRGYRFPSNETYQGESFYDVDKRVCHFLDSLPDQGEFLFVSHAGVIASLMHACCGLPDDKFVEGEFSYTMVTRFEFTRNPEGHYRGTYQTVHNGIQMPPLKMGK
ncbi:MAG: histidine phosphatase family protein [Fibrobacteraceae bacterium]|nr:histidine phosphatase family protein [Fibrobacteraceae bacterium]